jgi:quercetin 2,3-dioxygenase
MVYLADEIFQPHGETGMHPHHEIDVISVMVKDKIAHEGSLEHGGSFGRDLVQVQRAGGEGFKHNEINPDDTENRMIQLWILPENSGERAGYKLYDLKYGKLTKIYDGIYGNAEYMDGNTEITVGFFNKGDTFEVDRESLLYITRGARLINNDQALENGDLLRLSSGKFETTNEDTQVIVITTNK